MLGDTSMVDGDITLVEFCQFALAVLKTIGFKQICEKLFNKKIIVESFEFNIT